MDDRHHDLKCWPEVFEPLWNGEKTAEFRKNDRNYQTGDTLTQWEWNPETQQYTGRSIVCVVTHVLYGGKFGIPDGYCMMSIFVAQATRREVSNDAPTT